MTTKTKGGFLSRSVDMTEGPIFSSMIAFSIPLILSGILQTLYNAVDVMVVGNFASKEAVASVGATTIIINIFVVTITSVCNGSNIIFSRAIGAKDEHRIQRAMTTTYTFSLILGACITVLGILLARPMLMLTGCPDNIMEGAVTYIQIYMLAAPALVFYNFMSGVIKLSGDSKRPFYYLAISGLVNVVLNIVLVLLTGAAVVAVAVATVVAAWVSAVLTFVRLTRLVGACRFNPMKLGMHGETLLKIIRLGVPSAISSATFSLTNLQIQSAINSFGDVGIAGNTASISIENLLHVFTNISGGVVSAFMGQNIGAGNRERTLRVLKVGYLSFTATAVITGSFCLLFGKPLLGLIIPGEVEAIEFGYIRLAILSAVSGITAINSVTGGSLQSFGYTVFQMIVHLVGTCGFRFLWMAFIFPLSPTPLSLFICYPVSYAIVLILGLAVNSYLISKYKKGRNFAL